MNVAAQVVIEHFGKANGLGGFAIHNYQNSYLGGSMPWPGRNPLFPTNVLAITSGKRLAGGTIRLEGVGVPNHTHTVEWAMNPSATSFSPFSTVTPDDTGAFTFDDTRTDECYDEVLSNRFSVEHEPSKSVRPNGKRISPEYCSNQNESRTTEQSPRCVANFCAVLGQVSGAHYTDVRAINLRSGRRSADRTWRSGARYRWWKRRTIAHHRRHCWANRISDVHGSRGRYGRDCSSRSGPARADKHQLQTMFGR